MSKSYGEVVKTDGLSKEEWLEIRRTGIGGSDAGTVLGLNPFQSTYSLYADKIGELPLEDEGTKATEWGTKLEDVIARHFAEKHGTGVERVKRMLRSTDHPFMLADPDRRIQTQEWSDTPGILEIKTTRSQFAPMWDDKVPPYVYSQLQHYLAVMGYEWGYVAVLIGKDEYRDYFFERDDEFIENTLIPEEEDFWLNHVEPGNPPDVDGHDSTSEALSEIYDDPKEKTVEIEDEDVMSKLKTYDRLKEAKDEIEEDMDTIKNELKDEVQDASKALVKHDGEERTITWYQQSRRYPDKDAIFDEFPEITDEGGEDWSAEYSNESTYRSFRIY